MVCIIAIRKKMFYKDLQDFIETQYLIFKVFMTCLVNGYENQSWFSFPFQILVKSLFNILVIPTNSESEHPKVPQTSRFFSGKQLLKGS